METERKIQKLQEAIAEVEKESSFLNHQKLMNSFSDRTKSVSYNIYYIIHYIIL